MTKSGFGECYVIYYPTRACSYKFNSSTLKPKIIFQSSNNHLVLISRKVTETADC